MRESSDGGGLLTIVESCFDPVAVECLEYVELLIVELSVNDRNLRAFNGYGPQESEYAHGRLIFCQVLEKEVKKAKKNCVFNSY